MKNEELPPPTFAPAPVNDQWDYLISTIWNQMMHLVIALDGRLDPQRLLRATTLLISAEPILKSRFVESPVPAWVKVASLDPAAVFCFIPAEDADAALHEVLCTRIDPASGPPLRISFIRGMSDTVIISVNHTACDACGVRYLSTLLCTAYRSLEKNPDFTLPAGRDKDRSFTSLLSSIPPEIRFAIREANRAQSAEWGMPHRGFCCSSPAYSRKTLDSPLFTGLKSYAKLHGITINDLLLGAYFAGLLEVIPHDAGRNYPVLTSIDLRRYLPPGTSPCIANLSVAFEVRLPASRDLCFPDLVAEVSRVMKDAKKNRAGIGTALMMEEEFSGGLPAVRERLAALEQRSREEGYPKNPFFSNTGIIPRECADFGDIRVASVFMVPPVDYPPGFGLAVSTYNRCITIISGFCRDSLPPGEVDRLLSRMAEYLSSIVRA